LFKNVLFLLHKAFVLNRYNCSYEINIVYSCCRRRGIEGIGINKRKNPNHPTKSDTPDITLHDTAQECEYSCWTRRWWAPPHHSKNNHCVFKFWDSYWWV